MLLTSLIGKSSPDPLPDSTQEIILTTEPLLDNGVSLGVEIELENLHKNWKRNYIPADRSRDSMWSRETDGSLRGPSGTQYEFKFASPLRGQKVNQAIERFYEDFETQDLTEHSNLRTSMHIHVNMLNMTVDQLITTMLAGAILDKYIFSTTGASRPYTGYCKGAANELIEAVGTHVVRQASRDMIPSFASSRYYSLNAAALFKYGTLEFRHFATPATKEVAIGHINSCLTVRKVGLDTCEAVIESNEQFDWKAEETCTLLYSALAERSTALGVPQEAIMPVEEFSKYWNRGMLLGAADVTPHQDSNIEELLSHLAMEQPERQERPAQDRQGFIAGDVTRSTLEAYGTLASASLKTVLMSAERLGLVNTNNNGINVVGDWAYTLIPGGELLVLQLNNQTS